MNREQFAGVWKQLRGKLQEQWGARTHNQAEMDAGRRVQLAGTAQQRHAICRQRDERQLSDFRKSHRNWNLTL